MGIFGPDGKLVDREALRSVGFSGRGMSIPRAWVDDQNRKHEPVEHVDGGVAGEVIHEADGRTHSNVHARTIEMSLS